MTDVWMSLVCLLGSSLCLVVGMFISFFMISNDKKIVTLREGLVVVNEDYLRYLQEGTKQPQASREFDRQVRVDD